MKELLIDKEDAYNYVFRRTPIPKVPTGRVVHFRKFWENLYVVGQYWDTSLDDDRRYAQDPSCSGQSEDHDAIDIDQLRAEAQEAVSTTSETRIQDTSAVAAPDSNTLYDSQPSPSASQLSQIHSSGQPASLYTYAGHRISNGSSMPDSHRDDLIRAFLEPLIWSHGCRLEPPRSSPRLHLGRLLVPVRLNPIIYRAPKDRAAARLGGLEGPVAGVQTKGETSFESELEVSRRGHLDKRNPGVADLLRLTAAALHLAEERSREGKMVPSSTSPGGEEVPWWATTPRWGGGTGEEVGEPLDPSESRGPTESEDLSMGDYTPDETTTTQGSNRRQGPPPKKGRKGRAKALDAWRRLDGPISSRWDKRIQYCRIGRESRRGVDWDDVSFQSFLTRLSSILHSVLGFLKNYDSLQCRTY